jgi:hypothetical protein
MFIIFFKPGMINSMYIPLIVNKAPLTDKEDEILIQQRNNGCGWAKIARLIEEKFGTKRTPNQLKNNFNQRLRRLYPGRTNIKVNKSQEECKSSKSNKKVKKAKIVPARPAPR